MSLASPSTLAFNPGSAVIATAPVSAPPATERRIAPRRQPAVGTVCRLDTGVDGKRPPVGLIWNISNTGISMLLHEPQPAGAFVAGELQTVAGKNTMPVLMHVVHVKQIETGDYFVGGHFVRPLSEEEMKPFVA